MSTLEHPIHAGEVVRDDDVPGIKRALAETQQYLDRPEVRGMWRRRDALQARLAELEPMALPRPSNQTDKQRRVERCPRCRTVLPSEPEPQASEPIMGDQLVSAPITDGEAPSGSEKPEPSSPDSAPPQAPAQGPQGEEAPDPLASSPPPDDWVIVEAGNFEFKSSTGMTTVAKAVRDEPEKCAAFIRSNRGDPKLKAAMTTYLHAMGAK